jgi:prepilin-type N-terminal cleavage/methylation domain-containing protein
VPTEQLGAKGITVTLRVGTGDPGFSLIELILVLLVLGISSLIVVPNVNRGMRAQELRRTALGLAAAARDLRSRALYEGIPQPLVLHLPDNRYSVARRGEVHLPSAVRFAEVDGGEALDSGARRFLFFPNGSALPGRVRLTIGQGSPEYSIRFEPLTGRVEVLKAGDS